VNKFILKHLFFHLAVNIEAIRISKKMSKGLENFFSFHCDVKKNFETQSVVTHGLFLISLLLKQNNLAGFLMLLKANRQKKQCHHAVQLFLMCCYPKRVSSIAAWPTRWAGSPSDSWFCIGVTGL